MLKKKNRKSVIQEALRSFDHLFTHFNLQIFPFFSLNIPAMNSHKRVLNAVAAVLSGELVAIESSPRELDAVEETH